jgi:gliding motility-associated-like protein
MKRIKSKTKQLILLPYSTTKKCGKIKGAGRLCLLLFFFFNVSPQQFALAQSSSKQLLLKPFQNKVFIKEQGQFKKTAEQTKTPFKESILYGVENAEFNAYFTTHGIIFQFPERKIIEKKDRKKKGEEFEEKTVETTWHTVNMVWLNTDSAVSLIAEQKASEYYNYGGFKDKATYNFVPAYKKLTYKNLYPGVDAVFELSEQGGIKYKFIVQPNVVIPAISFQWQGVKKISVDSTGSIHIKAKFSPFSINTAWHITDHAPTAFTGSSHKEVPVKYDIKNNTVKLTFLDREVFSSEGIIIDPWITNTNYPATNRAYDIQEDSLGNVFVIGNNTDFHVEKYSAAGVLKWVYVTNSVFLGDIAVDNPGNTYIIGGYPSGKRQKLDTAGVQVWEFSGLAEEWRLAFNYSKTILTEGGYFNGSPGDNLGKIDINTGAISNEIPYGAETRAIATDCNGDIYSLHVTFGTVPAAISNVLRKTNANFTRGDSVPSGFLLSEAETTAGYAPNPTYGGAVYQGTNAIVVSGYYVFIYDGAKLQRFKKSPLAFVNSVIVPNGTAVMCSGVATDLCGNIYAGTLNGIVKYDSSLTYIQTISTPGAVYDIILAAGGNLLACGDGFLGSFNTNCVPISPLNVIEASTNASCNGGSANISVSGGVPQYDYLWQPGGQTTASINNLAAGIYTYTVIDQFCHSYHDTVAVRQTATLSATPGLSNVISPGVISNESCPNSLDGSAVVNVSGGKTPYFYSWNTNPVQSTPIATGLAAGAYRVIVVDADSCTDTLSVVISRTSSTTANFGNTNVCKGNTTVFTDSSSTTLGTIISWKWNFGDGTTDSIQSPSHLYVNAGNYIVTLITNNNIGCSDTIQKAVEVYYSPIVSFTQNNVCFGDTMYFNNTSSVDISTSIATYLWVFGDASPTSNLQTPVHYYSSSGVYSITLVTTTVDGCSNVYSHSVNSFDAPSTSFSLNNACISDSVLFSNTSTIPSMGSIASWSWNYGDGSPLNTTVWNPNHLYATPGNYVVTLITGSSNMGCADTLRDTIKVSPKPVANFGFIDVCLKQPLNFSDSSSVLGGGNDSITNRLWMFGDGTAVSNVYNPSHVYPSFGTDTVSLIVTTNNGCKDTAVKNVFVHPLPTVGFTTSNVCDGTIVQLSALGSTPTADTIQSWIWNYGAGSNLINNQNSSHLYSASGSYTIKLILVSSFGCTDSISKQIIVNPNPQVRFTVSDTVGCEPLCVNFHNQSLLTTGSFAIRWNFGDSAYSVNSGDSIHCYANDSVTQPNFFNVSLTVTSDSGCVKTLSKNNSITVYPKPSAGFLVQPPITSIINPVISFTNLSVGANSWNWNFGDSLALLTSASDTSSLFNPPAHTYPNAGSYAVTLITSTHYGCVATTTETIVIEPEFVFYIPNAFTPNDDGINDTFAGVGIFVSKYEMSLFDRWGNLIFFTDNIKKPWDGKANYGTEIAQGDVYVYSIKIIDTMGHSHSYKGRVTLVR